MLGTDALVKLLHNVGVALCFAHVVAHAWHFIELCSFSLYDLKLGLLGSDRSWRLKVFRLSCTTARLGIVTEASGT